MNLPNTKKSLFRVQGEETQKRNGGRNPKKNGLEKGGDKMEATTTATGSDGGRRSKKRRTQAVNQSGRGVWRREGK